MKDNTAKSPYGTTLLSRDTPENRAIWGPEGIGVIPVASTICTSDNQCPHYQYDHDASRESALYTPIHLLIASFRDQLCPRTLYNAFMRAENPHRVFIRVLEQSVKDSDLVDDAGCWDRYCTDYNTNCEEFRANVKIIHRDASLSKGPTDARSRLSAMIYHDYVHRDEPSKLHFQRVEPEDFCMETDSHMDFHTNYDTELILMFHRTKNDFAVLSTYVADLSENNVDPVYVPNLCMVTFTSTIRNWGTKQCRNLITPKLTNAMWGAGLSFHRCHAELNVPVDPYLSGVFDGEEGSRGIRFFTHGYDVYTPDQVLVTHDYKKHQSNPVVHTWGKKSKGTAEVEDSIDIYMEEIERQRPNIRTTGTSRVNMMLGIGHDHESKEDQEEIERIRRSRFGLGTKRTLEQAVEFSGINLRERKMEKNKCGNLLWVPYEENASSDYYGLQEILGRGLVDEGTGVPPSTVNTGLVKSARNLSVESSHDVTARMVKIGGVLVLLVLHVSTMTARRFRKKGERHKN